MFTTTPIFPLTTTKKARIYASIYKVKDDIFNIEYLKSYKDNIRHIDISKLFRFNTEGYFECPFLSGNFAWIGISDDGVYRYFTQNKYKVLHAFDIFDLLSIYFNTNFKGVIIELKNYNIRYRNIWREEQRKKYEYNLMFIDAKLKNYPYLKETLNKHINIYRELNKFAMNNIGSKKALFEKEAIFFISTTYLRDEYSKKSSISTVNQLVNLLAVLGLINKVPQNYPSIKDINTNAINSEILCAINYYTIPNIEVVINRAENIAKTLVKNNIKYYKINRKTLVEILGVDFANKIYTQILGGGDKKIVSKRCKKERELLEHLFNVSLINNGYVIREEIKNNAKFLSDKSFEKFWIELVKIHGGESIIPTKKIKSMFNLNTNQSIYIRDKGVNINNLLIK